MGKYSVPGDQVNYFASTVLQIPDWEILFNNDQLSLLKLVVKQYSLKRYFQNISVASKEHEDYHYPTEQEVVNNIIQGSGGKCHHHGSAFTFLLQGMGFDAYLIGGCVRGMVDCHVMTIVRIGGNPYYVDVGSGNPVYGPIALHELPVKVRSAGFDIEFRRNYKGLYERVHHKGDFRNGAYDEGTPQRVHMTFDLIEKSYSHFRVPIETTRSIPTTFLYIFGYAEVSEDNQDFKVYLLNGTDFIVATKKTRVLIEFTNYEEILSEKVVQKYFPLIDMEEVKVALVNIKDQLGKKEGQRLKL